MDINNRQKYQNIAKKKKIKKIVRINKLRAIMFLMLIFISTTGLKIKTFTPNEINKPKMNIEIHIVSKNETIWSIADIYNNGMDKREYVNQILKLNDNNPIIHQGEIISIPIFYNN